MGETRSILLIGNFLSSSGRNQGVCEELARRLALAGWRVLTASNRPGRAARLLDMAITSWRERPRYAVAHVDVFSGPAFLWAETACWSLRRARKPYLLTLRGGSLPQFARARPGRVRRLLDSAAVVTAPSPYLLEEMRPYREDLRLTPNPLDAGACRFQVRVRPRARLVWLRAFHEIYNPSLGAKVLALLRSEFPDVSLTMVGPDKGDGSLQRLARTAEALGVSGLLKLPGAVRKAEVPKWLGRDDIFLNTTNVDNAPVSVLEAMACGLCVVSTNVGGIPKLLGHEVDALLTPPDDPTAMAAAIRRILTEPGLAHRLSQNARRKAQSFDWSVVLPQWESLLTAVAERGPR